MSAHVPAPAHATAPRNAVVILLDSLNRHLLGAYGSDEFETPNLDRVAARSTRFTNHHAGSLPCMPARHDLLCGSLDFLWRPWGSLELWDEPITRTLRRADVVTQLVSDHPHLFETGGENYHCEFTAWDYLRGHEGDLWRTRPDPSWVGAPRFGRGHSPYDNSRGFFRDEADFPGPRTMASAARWLAEDAPHHRDADQRWMLFVDEFDPHEPFDTPEPWASRYDPEWDVKVDGPHLMWPPYTGAGLANGMLSERQGRQIRAQYGAKLSMIDHHLGRVLDQLDTGGWWDDTAVIVCTDHGHYLGERDAWGKPAIPLYEPLLHTPLFIHWPGLSSAGTSVEALSTNVDLHATLCDLFGVETPSASHGRSLRPLLDGSATSVRGWALAGVWGREVHVLDDTRKYVRAPAGTNEPLSMWSNRWSTMPLHDFPELRLPNPDDRATLDRMPGSDIPVIRQPFVDGDLLPFWGYAESLETLCFDRSVDPDEAHDLVGTSAEREMAELLRVALTEVSAPDDQFARLGLA
ncbi:MAG: sulfatase [Microthrixaceae bacterium]